MCDVLQSRCFFATLGPQMNQNELPLLQDSIDEANPSDSGFALQVTCIYGQNFCL